MVGPRGEVVYSFTGGLAGGLPAGFFGHPWFAEVATRLGLPPGLGDVEFLCRQARLFGPRDQQVAAVSRTVRDAMRHLDKGFVGRMETLAKKLVLAELARGDLVHEGLLIITRTLSGAIEPVVVVAVAGRARTDDAPVELPDGLGVSRIERFGDVRVAFVSAPLPTHEPRTEGEGGASAAMADVGASEPGRRPEEIAARRGFDDALERARASGKPELRMLKFSVECQVQLETYPDGSQVVVEIYLNESLARDAVVMSLLASAIGAPISRPHRRGNVVMRQYQPDPAPDSPEGRLFGLYEVLIGGDGPHAQYFRDAATGAFKDHELPLSEIFRIRQQVANQVGEFQAVGHSFWTTSQRRRRWPILRDLAEMERHALHTPAQRQAREGLTPDAGEKFELLKKMRRQDYPQLYPQLVEFDHPYVPADVVAQVKRALDDFMAEHRGRARLERITVDLVPRRKRFRRRPYAETYPPEGDTAKGCTITLDLGWIADPDGMQSVRSHNLREGLHPRGSGRAVYDALMHEHGHVLDFCAPDFVVETLGSDGNVVESTGERIAAHLEDVLIEVHRRLVDAGLIVGVYQDCRVWIRLLPRAAFHDDAKSRLHAKEAIGVGVEAVQINGGMVGWPQWVIHHYATTGRIPVVTDDLQVHLPPAPEQPGQFRLRKWPASRRALQEMYGRDIADDPALGGEDVSAAELASAFPDFGRVDDDRVTPEALGRYLLNSPAGTTLLIADVQYSGDGYSFDDGWLSLATHRGGHISDPQTGQVLADTVLARQPGVIRYIVALKPDGTPCNPIPELPDAPDLGDQNRSPHAAVLPLRAGSDVGWWFPDVTRVLERLGERPPTTYELRQDARDLVERYPGRCELLTPQTHPDLLGYTHRGTPLEVLVVHAEAPDAPAALVYPQVHSNEPWATGTAKALLDYVTSEPAARQRTWVVLLGLDPDAAMRAEGWAAHIPLSLENAIRTFYRGAGDEQPEWSFDEDSGMPEVQALVGVLRAYRPDLVFSLHNSEIAFPTVAVTDHVPGIVEVVAQAAAESGFSDFESIGDFIGLTQLGPGVFKSSADSPWTRIADYASRHRAERAALVVLEGSMWRGRDPGLTPIEAAGILEQRVAVLSELAAKLPSDPASDLYRAATFFIDASTQAAQDYREDENWRAQTADGPVAKSAEWAHIKPLRAAGMMWRFVHELLVTDPADTVLDRVERELDGHITQWSQQYQHAFAVGPACFADTVGYQLKVILATALPLADPQADGAGDNGPDGEADSGPGSPFTPTPELRGGEAETASLHGQRGRVEHLLGQLAPQYGADAGRLLAPESYRQELVSIAASPRFQRDDDYDSLVELTGQYHRLSRLIWMLGPEVLRVAAGSGRIFDGGLAASGPWWRSVGEADGRVYELVDVDGAVWRLWAAEDVDDEYQSPGWRLQRPPGDHGWVPTDPICAETVERISDWIVDSAVGGDADGERQQLGEQQAAAGGGRGQPEEALAAAVARWVKVAARIQELADVFPLLSAYLDDHPDGLDATNIYDTLDLPEAPVMDSQWVLAFEELLLLRPVFKLADAEVRRRWYRGQPIDTRLVNTGHASSLAEVFTRATTDSYWVHKRFVEQLAVDLSGRYGHCLVMFSGYRPPDGVFALYGRIVGDGRQLGTLQIIGYRQAQGRSVVILGVKGRFGEPLSDRAQLLETLGAELGPWLMQPGVVDRIEGPVLATAHTAGLTAEGKPAEGTRAWYQRQPIDTRLVDPGHASLLAEVFTTATDPHAPYAARVLVVEQLADDLSGRYGQYWVKFLGYRSLGGGIEFSGRIVRDGQQLGKVVITCHRDEQGRLVVTLDVKGIDGEPMADHTRMLETLHAELGPYLQQPGVGHIEWHFPTTAASGGANALRTERERVKREVEWARKHMARLQAALAEWRRGLSIDVDEPVSPQTATDAPVGENMRLAAMRRRADEFTTGARLLGLYLVNSARADIYELRLAELDAEECHAAPPMDPVGELYVAGQKLRSLLYADREGLLADSLAELALVTDEEIRSRWPIALVGLLLRRGLPWRKPGLADKLVQAAVRLETALWRVYWLAQAVPELPEQPGTLAVEAHDGVALPGLPTVPAPPPVVETDPIETEPEQGDRRALIEGLAEAFQAIHEALVESDRGNTHPQHLEGADLAGAPLDPGESYDHPMEQSGGEGRAVDPTVPVIDGRAVDDVTGAAHFDAAKFDRARPPALPPRPDVPDAADLGDTTSIDSARSRTRRRSSSDAGAPGDRGVGGRAGKGSNKWVPRPDWLSSASRDPVHFLRLPDYAPGSLSRAQVGVVRAHADERLRQFNDALDGKGDSVADRARQVWELRNEVISWTRRLMGEPHQVAEDERRQPTPSFEDRVTEYRREGLDADAAHRAIVRNPIRIDRGIDPTRLPALPPRGRRRPHSRREHDTQRRRPRRPPAPIDAARGVIDGPDGRPVVDLGAGIAVDGANTGARGLDAQPLFDAADGVVDEMLRREQAGQELPEWSGSVRGDSCGSKTLAAARAFLSRVPQVGAGQPVVWVPDESVEEALPTQSALEWYAGGYLRQVGVGAAAGAAIADIVEHPVDPVNPVIAALVTGQVSQDRSHSCFVFGHRDLLLVYDPVTRRVAPFGQGSALAGWSTVQVIEYTADARPRFEVPRQGEELGFDPKRLNDADRQRERLPDTAGTGDSGSEPGSGPDSAEPHPDQDAFTPKIVERDGVITYRHRYRSAESVDGRQGFGVWAELDPTTGVLRFEARRGEGTPPTEDMFDDMMAALGERVRVLEVVWATDTPGTAADIDYVNMGVREVGCSPEGAARYGTVCGVLAARFEYSSVSIDPASVQGDLGRWTRAVVRFARPADAPAVSDGELVVDGVEKALAAIGDLSVDASDPGSSLVITIDVGRWEFVDAVADALADKMRSLDWRDSAQVDAVTRVVRGAAGFGRRRSGAAVARLLHGAAGFARRLRGAEPGDRAEVVRIMVRLSRRGAAHSLHVSVERGTDDQSDGPSSDGTGFAPVSRFVDPSVLASVTSASRSGITAWGEVWADFTVSGGEPVSAEATKAPRLSSGEYPGAAAARIVR